MARQRILNPVYRSLNKPLTIWGAERRLFLLAIGAGGATFNFFASLLAGLLMFIVLLVLARWATANDPEMLRIVLNSSKLRARYDPAKRERFALRIV